MTDLVAGLKEYRRRMEAAARVGMAQAGARLLSDCIMELPTVPMKETTLRGSGSVIIDGTCTMTAAELGYTDGTPATEVSEADFPVEADKIRAVVGFNSPYAAYQHEGMRKDASYVVENYSEPGSGAKFIQDKLAENAEDYIAVAAAGMKAVMEGANA